MVRFEPLTRCDVDGCEVLGEPHVGRCESCRRKHGRLTKDEVRFQRSKRSKPTGSMPLHVWQERRRREAERARRPVKGGVK